MPQWRSKKNLLNDVLQYQAIAQQNCLGYEGQLRCLACYSVNLEGNFEITKFFPFDNQNLSMTLSFHTQKAMTYVNLGHMRFLLDRSTNRELAFEQLMSNTDPNLPEDVFLTLLNLCFLII